MTEKHTLDASSLGPYIKARNYEEGGEGGWPVEYALNENR
jgi:hypothetical protein